MLCLDYPTLQRIMRKTVMVVFSSDVIVLLSLRFINKFLKKEDYSSLLFFTTAINELIAYNASLSMFNHTL